MKLKKWFGITALAATAVIGLAACGSGNKNADAKTVKIGVMTKSDSEEKRWNKIQELLKKDNIKLQFTEFTDYRIKQLLMVKWISMLSNTTIF